MNSQITDRAFAGKCPGLGASGFKLASAAIAVGASRPSWSSSPANASMPSPDPVRRRNDRRVGNAGAGVANKCGSFGMAHSADHSWLLGVDKFVQADQDLTE